MDEEGGGDLEITEKYESDGSTDQVIQESNSQTSEGVSIFESKKKKSQAIAVCHCCWAGGASNCNRK
jgi:hypothetical protein